MVYWFGMAVYKGFSYFIGPPRDNYLYNKVGINKYILEAKQGLLDMFIDCFTVLKK